MPSRTNARQGRKYLRNLTASVSIFLSDLDAEMMRLSSPERGKRIAKLTNYLDLANDIAMHYGLNMSFGSIKNRKSQLERTSAASSDGSRNLTLDTRGRFEQRVLGPSEEKTKGGDTR
jgi:hypothetical protein